MTKIKMPIKLVSILKRIWARLNAEVQTCIRVENEIEHRKREIEEKYLKYRINYF